MQAKRRTIFYKILLVIVLVGMLPAMLLGARLLTFNRDLLQAGGEGWTLSGDEIQQITGTLTSTAGVYLIIIFLVIGLTAIFIARGLVNPLRQLSQIVERFRQGEVDQHVDIHTGDEIEELATSFTRTARELILSQRNLETRITERAGDLERRVLQLQIAAQVARDTASARDLPDLLERAVNLIYERFKFYHVSIFLLDDNKEYAVLRAATGEAGRIQKQRSFKLKVGDVGIIGSVTKTGELRIVNDVGKDFVYRKDPLLPDTHSETAIPLKIGPQVIGVLDVQSSQVDAFGEDDVASLQILADQLAVAIQNARLVAQLETRLREINTLYQQYTRESWLQASKVERSIGYQYDLSSVVPMQQALPAEILAQVQPGRVMALDAEHLPEGYKPMLVAPLALYDQLIGVLGIQKDVPGHDGQTMHIDGGKTEWSADEIALIEAVSNQVALALDNARLLEETQVRTDQLRLLQEITAVAISHVKVDELLDAVAIKMKSGFNLQDCEIILFNRSDKGYARNKDLTAGEPIGAILRSESEYIQQEVLTRKSMVIALKGEDIQGDQAAAHGAAHGATKIYEWLKMRDSSMLVVAPLISRDEVIGVIGMEVADSTRRFSQNDLQLVDQISLQISAAIDVARGFEEAAQYAEREKLIAGITARMRETLDVETVLQKAVNEIYQKLDLDEVSFTLAAREADEAELLSPTLEAEDAVMGGDEAERSGVRLRPGSHGPEEVES
jgi:GAF domain-containing protein/HAMP domain-containing protein